MSHFENFNKRLVKTPKIYWNDTGLLCYLLGLNRAEDLRVHPLRGAIFETFVVAELRKLYLHHGRRPQIYFFRDSNGREVDVILDFGVVVYGGRESYQRGDTLVRSWWQCG